ncbi:unnamed protein product [Penicillium nalgiovense]|uniref:RNase H type-1 domain-containing protein n=1 Tax=Penicillium nalgiovense TaxID=60175 RepID=A0A9W4HPS5_PENNA|nr:unnamed protein product [Penicillium nalgiovense]CAG7980508.1 unnamed protein product [Penicillium nalgiovense]CAG7994581.1 unnamed protein product [Penicillium nalgiovense]CAG8003850.1 unnamed protein product [Penicillium nalgiovense]CAG8013815.1 unnamed protein product [Penicillium nalgiovense]
MRQLGLASKRVRSASCPPALGQGRHHAPQMTTEPEPTTSCAFGQSPAVSQGPTQVPGQTQDLPGEFTISLKKAFSSLNESPASPNEPTPGPSEPPTGPNTAISVLTESIADLKTTIAHLTESVTDLGTTISSLKESIPTKSPTGSNQSVTSLGEFSGPSGPPTRSSNTSPEPGSRKRKRSSTDSLVESPRPSKAIKKEAKRFSWELGHEFSGFVSSLEACVAVDIAKNILRLPIPANVCKRLVYFSDASIRSFYGAVGIVWTESFISPKWEGKGIPYHSKIDSTAVLELFGIACALELAIKDIDKPHAMVNQSLPQDKEFFQDHLLHTRSHLHTKSKEVFIFTDDIFALKRVSGDLPYPPNGDISTQLEVISRHSKALDDLGVHIELHLSPGHRRIPGNREADNLARRTQNRMERK